MNMSKKVKRPQTIAEERANALTHGLGLLAVLILYPFLIKTAYKGEGLISIVGILLFFFGSVFMYSASTTYHFIKHPTKKIRARIVDHISIFFLIGGTYAAVVQCYVPQSTAIWFMSVMWSIILVGAFLKIFFTGKYQWVSVILYLFLGWMAIFIYKPLYNNMSWDVFQWLLYGGLAYTLGVIFYKNQKLPYSHAIWHIFVLMGTFCHFIGIYKSF
jgi:hemolysin III